MRGLDLPHLVRRFFQVLRPRPLSPAEQADVASRLLPDERRLFWAQSFADQRHAYETMRRSAHVTVDRLVHRAALLHDVGKSAVTIGAIARSVATLADAVGAPMSDRFRTYRRHGPLGAEMLSRIGSEPLVVEFAARHPDPDPGECDPAQWQVLLDADDV